MVSDLSVLHGFSNMSSFKQHKQSELLLPLDSLLPVHDYIVHHLSLIAPLKTLTLSKYYYRHTIPILYHTVPITSKSLYGLLWSVHKDARARTLQAFSNTRVIRLVNLDSILTYHHLSMTDPKLSETPEEYNNLLSNVRRIEFMWEAAVSPFYTLYNQTYPDQPAYRATIQRLVPSPCEELVVHLKNNDGVSNGVLDFKREISQMLKHHSSSTVTIILHLDLLATLSYYHLLEACACCWKEGKLQRIIINLSNVDHFSPSSSPGSDFCRLLYAVISKFNSHRLDNILGNSVQELVVDILKIYIPRADSVQEYLKACDLKSRRENRIEGAVKISELEKDVLEEYAPESLPLSVQHPRWPPIPRVS